MKSYYDILGVAKNATDDDIKKAYRRLSSAHHPDKHVNETEAVKAEHEAKFKEAKEAYETLSDPVKRRQYDSPKSSFNQGFGTGATRHPTQSEIDEILAMMRQAHSNFRQTIEIATRVPIKEAFYGAEMPITINGVQDSFKIPRGIPDGVRISIKTKGGVQLGVSIQLVCEPGYHVNPAHGANYQAANINGELTGAIETGDVEVQVDVDALDLILGAWIDVKDITDTSYSVRVPAGFDLRQRLRVKGAGYYNWLVDKNEASRHRADMYVRVKPTFKAAKDLDVNKVDALHAIVHNANKTTDEKSA